MNDMLIIIDMQNDFINGTLGTPQAAAVVANVRTLIERSLEQSDTLVFTRDTHDASYPNTQEGRMLPIAHCLKKTRGWEIHPALNRYTPNAIVVDKTTFGSFELIEEIRPYIESDTEIKLAGICTDICVVTNALLIKTAYPENKVSVHADCCAGVSPQSHDAAIATMAACQINIINSME